MNFKTFSLSCLALLGAALGMSSAHAAPKWTVTPTSHSCPNNTIGSPATLCGTTTITAPGGHGSGEFIRYKGWSFVSGDINSFMVGFGITCQANMAIGQYGTTWCSLQLKFQPTKEGLNQAVIAVKGENQPDTLITLTGTATAAPSLGVAGPDPLACGTVAVGSSGNCGSLTLTAQNGPVTLSGSPFSILASDFQIDPGSCTPNRALAFNESCQTGQITFHPGSEGSRTVSMQISSSAAAVVRSVTGNGVLYTYDWYHSGFGACEAGSGEWQLGNWSPTNGCGIVEQSRTATCAVGADSGTRTQTVLCRRNDGVTVDDSMCSGAGAKPASSESCTPTADVCGDSPETTQQGHVNSDCYLNTCTPDRKHGKFCLFLPF